VNRRSFIQKGAVAFPYVARASVRGANDRVQIGFVGVGARAKYLIQHEDFGEARIVSVADAWLTRMGEAAKVRPQGEQWGKYSDYRRMFEKEKLDAVFVETTTHARALICIEAMQAGLDVYAEKPLSVTIQEGQVLTKAARKYKRVLQVGTQQRSMPINIFASNLVASGKIGKIQRVIVCKFIAPEVWVPQPEQPMPEGLNWDQWINQTPMRPYHTLLHRGWPRWRDYDGGGQSWGVSGWGTHSLDQVQAALGTSLTGPIEISVDREGPDSKVFLKYANGAIVALEQEIIKDHQQLGAIFEGTNGRIQIIRGDFSTDRPELKKAAPDVIKEGPGENVPHIRNFVQCIKSRQRPNADVEIGHRSTTVCHLVNIARELGRTLHWDPKAEHFKDDPAADKLIARERRKGFELPRV
jgi:predicted dehydrogenase